MKVKVGQLKTHLSRYLQKVRDTGESIEVCVREDTVAYLCSAAKAEDASMPSPELNRSLESDGLRVIHRGNKSKLLPTPGSCATPALGNNSIERIRAEKNW